MRSGSCPGQAELEEYFYGHLSPPKARAVRYHVGKCSRCRQSLEDIRRFQQVLSSIPLEEPPPELYNRIIELIQEPETVTNCQRAAGVRRPVFSRPVFSVRIRWAASAALLLLNFVFYRQFRDHVGVFGPRTYILGWADLKFIYDRLVSGALWSNLKQVLVALRVDGLFALEIIGNVLPGWVLNVVILSGLALVTWIAHLLVSRSGGRRA